MIKSDKSNRETEKKREKERERGRELERKVWDRERDQARWIEK